MWGACGRVTSGPLVSRRLPLDYNFIRCIYVLRIHGQFLPGCSGLTVSASDSTRGRSIHDWVLVPAKEIPGGWLSLNFMDGTQEARSQICSGYGIYNRMIF